MATEIDYGTGRRKTSTARGFLTRGQGRILIQRLAVDEDYHRPHGPDPYSALRQRAGQRCEADGGVRLCVTRFRRSQRRHALRHQHPDFRALELSIRLQSSDE